MNERERYIAAMSFQHPARVPFMPGNGRQSTLANWHQQGLPDDVTDYHAYLREQIGIAPIACASPDDRIGIGVDFRMIPQFEEKVIEHRPSSDPGNPKVPGVLVVQDWKGNICEISDEYDVSYLREAHDFVTRSWLKCPVESRDDWRDMAMRYDMDAPGRWPEDYEDRCAKLQNRDYISKVIIPGPFWQLREWCGFEELCMLFIDDPDFAHEMIAFWRDFVAGMLQRLLENHVPDLIVFSEDMAYKEKPMIGPDMSRTFLLDTWRTWAEICRGAGVPVIELDSDGQIESLIPLYIEAGFNSVSPMEVAAGIDLTDFRKQFGKKMAFCGGVDKREMARGGQAIKQEIARLQPVIESGGYIPSCDHGVPSDVSWPAFVEYGTALAKATGWLK